RGEIIYETEVFPSDPAWLNDHRVFARLVAPGALYGAMAASAAIAEGSSPIVVEDFQLHNPLVFAESDATDGSAEEGRTVQVFLDDSGQVGSKNVQIFSKGIENEWILHIEGRVSSDAQVPEAGGRVDLKALKARLSSTDVPDYYRAKADTGINLGPFFRTLGNVWSAPGEALGEVNLPEAAGRNDLNVHPLLMDGCFQVIGVARNMTGEPGEATYLPFGWERFWLTRQLPDRLVCHVIMSEASTKAESESEHQPEVMSGEMRIYD
ncbi:MAG: polyketide synthase dehydratase domain-containing protein, partial [Chloroflexi bacterium]|nr:polyketide synthase dehydratase domain-containing protein [Chloroflexota bacterium]